MQAFARTTAPASDSDTDQTLCPNCSEPALGPISTDYRGLGRMEHRWQCTACGQTFCTRARMAGVVEAEPEAAAA